MSGRVIVSLADGRRVRGYRKTLVQRGARRTSWQLPDWRLSFMLPDDMRFLGLTPGRVDGLTCVRVEPGLCVIAGKNREFLLDQAVAFMRKVVPDFVGTISIVLSRGAEPGPTLSGPGHHPERKEGRIQIGRSDAKVLFGTTLRVLNLTGCR